MASSDLRAELAATAARLIAEEGCEYAQAKRRAVHEVLGEGDRRVKVPDNMEIERELRRYLKLFGGESHGDLLAARRKFAAEVMRTLQEFDPHLIGALLNGTATEHSDVNLQLFVDSAKDVELRLINLGIEFDVEEGGDERPAALERLSFILPFAPAAPATPTTSRTLPIGVRLHIYPRDAIRIAARNRRDLKAEDGMHPIEAAGRANLAALQKLIDETC